MKILHTSDWHLGRLLFTHKRYDEFSAFLAWLIDVLDREVIDVLLVAGDVFDTTTPSHRAQELYYRFLCQAVADGRRHVVVTAGNHDSPTFLDAPKTVLESIRVRVVGSAAADPADEVIVLPGASGEPEVIVCAVPFLRDRDLRTVEAGELPEDKERKLTEGIQRHYTAVAAAAAAAQEQVGRRLPVVAMGHLFAAGGQTVEGDGVRDLYVGSLAHVGSDMFPPIFNYCALGHLHTAQSVGGDVTRRYSGAPLAMGFGERAGKSVLIVEFTGLAPAITPVPVPCFQELVRLQGGWPEIADGIRQLRQRDSRALIEIIYDGSGAVGDLRQMADEAIAGSALNLLRIKNLRVAQQALNSMDSSEELDDLDPEEVFRRCLDARSVAEQDRLELLLAYREAAAALHNADPNAE